MHSHRIATVAAVAFLVVTLLPLSLASPAGAATVCGTYRSETTPPPTIRVYRTATGSVETVDFRSYAKNVLSREWISSWTTESLRAGALAVKNYAWYQVLHWRGHVNGAGACFDVFDSTRDQHYDPTRPVYGPMAAAVDATWGTLAHKGGRVFPTYYNAGSAYEACGARANGWQMFQWGTQACGLAGKTAAQIVAIYYAGVTVSAPPPPATPAPTPRPTPRPTLAPAPTIPPTPGPTAKPSVAPSSGATPAPRAPASTVPAPTIAPTPVAPARTPAPTAQPPLVSPGGGQAGLAVPPPPPPPDPDPIVVTGAGVDGRVAVAGARAEVSRPVPGRADMRGLHDHAIVQFEQAADRARSVSSRLRPHASHRAVLRSIVLRYIVTQVLAESPSLIVDG